MKITKAQANKCVTHYYGCDCQQYKYQQLQSENKRLREDRDLWKQSEDTCNKRYNELFEENELLREQVFILKQKPTWLCGECSNQWDIRNAIQRDALQSTEQDNKDGIN